MSKKSDIHDGVGLFFCCKSNIPDYSGTNSFFYALIFKRLGRMCKNYYAERAYKGLQNLNPKIESCWVGGRSDGCKNLRNKSPQLIQYLQAYDLLKTGGKIAHNADDNSSDDCNPRNKLRQFAANMYRNSDPIINSSSGWKKKQGIICSSVLGMAAI